MSARVSLQMRIDNYLAERHRLGFELRSRSTLLASFARYVESLNHRRPLTTELMADWARQDKWHHDTPATWAARLAIVRDFARYLRQFEPDTEIPEEPVFGPERARVAPHIFHEEEVVALLAAAHRLGPKGSVRPATYETLFGLMASTGLRISEAIHLRDADVSQIESSLNSSLNPGYSSSRLLGKYAPCRRRFLRARPVVIAWVGGQAQSCYSCYRSRAPGLSCRPHAASLPAIV
jgi:integrase